MVHYQEDYEQCPKNAKTALLLALLLGPIGMFYATVTWAAIMLFMNVVFGALTYGIAIIILWPVGGVSLIGPFVLAMRNCCDKKIIRRNDFLY